MNFFTKKQNDTDTAADVDKELQQFYADIDNQVKEQIKCMDAMGRQELIKYAAETRLNAMNYLMQQQQQLNTAWDCIRCLNEKIEVMADTINLMIVKKPVKRIDLQGIADRVAALIAKEAKK